MPEDNDFTLPPDWGVKLEPSVEWIGGYECDRCHTDFVSWYNYIVGYTQLSLKSENRPYGSNDGAIIIECPKCTKRYWLHADAVPISIMRDNAKEGRVKGYPLDQFGQPL